jgi:hypothetical protein
MSPLIDNDVKAVFLVTLIDVSISLEISIDVKAVFFVASIDANSFVLLSPDEE